MKNWLGMRKSGAAFTAGTMRWWSQAFWEGKEAEKQDHSTGFVKSRVCLLQRPAWRNPMGCGPWEKKGPGKVVTFAESLLPRSRTAHPKVQKTKSRWQEAWVDWGEGKTHKIQPWEGKIGEFKARSEGMHRFKYSRMEKPKPNWSWIWVY